jgi:hypothetical protein
MAIWTCPDSDEDRTPIRVESGGATGARRPRPVVSHNHGGSRPDARPLLAQTLRKPGATENSLLVRTRRNHDASLLLGCGAVAPRAVEAWRRRRQSISAWRLAPCQLTLPRVLRSPADWTVRRSAWCAFAGSLQRETGAAVHRRRSPYVHGADDLLGGDALQIVQVVNRCACPSWRRIDAARSLRVAAPQYGHGAADALRSWATSR